MKFHLFIPLVAAILSLAGCASSPVSVKVSAGTVRAHTFSLVNPGARPPAGTGNSESVHRMIQGAITRNLASRGISKSAGGDLTVAYLVVIGNHSSTETISDYFGHNDDTEKLQDKAHDAYVGNGNRNSFEAGTLIIDIVDSRTSKLLKRGYATRPLLRNLPAPAHREKIQEAVDSILSDLKVAP